MNIYEVDQYDFSVCPFNSTHRFCTEQYKFHIIRCRDRNYPHISSNIVRCCHNTNHIFLSVEKLKYHEPRCPEFQGREHHTQGKFGEQPVPVAYTICQYNPLHKIRTNEPRAYQYHVDQCPNRFGNSPVLAAPAVALDTSISGQLNYKHGLISMQDISLCLPAVNGSTKPIDNRKIAVHYGGKSFNVFKEDFCDFEEQDLWISQLTNADPRFWPGLRWIESSRAHSKYLVATLHPDQSSVNCANRFKSFCGMLAISSSNNQAISASYQASSDKDQVYLVVHSSEDTGFGACVKSAEIGLFSVPHSMLFNRASAIGTLQNRIKEIELEANGIIKNYTDLSTERDYLVDQYNQLKIECENFKNQLAQAQEKNLANDRIREEELLDLKNRSLGMLAEYKSKNEQEKAQMIQQIERFQREKLAAQMNYESDLQNLKNANKLNTEKANKKAQELLTELEKARSENTALQKQLKTKEGHVSSMKDQVKRASISIEEQKNAFLSSDQQMLIDQIVKSDRERQLCQMQEREMCSICCMEKKNVVFVPCGHLAYCKGCFLSLGLDLGREIPRGHHHKVCPVCEYEIKKAYQAFPY